MKNYHRTPFVEKLIQNGYRLVITRDGKGFYAQLLKRGYEIASAGPEMEFLLPGLEVQLESLSPDAFQKFTGLSGV